MGQEPGCRADAGGGEDCCGQRLSAGDVSSGAREHVHFADSWTPLTDSLLNDSDGRPNIRVARAAR
jgi:hypothetical protein